MLSQGLTSLANSSLPQTGESDMNVRLPVPVKCLALPNAPALLHHPSSW